MKFKFIKYFKLNMKMIFIITIFVIIFSTNNYARYNYTYKVKAFSLQLEKPAKINNKDNNIYSNNDSNIYNNDNIHNNNYTGNTNNSFSDNDAEVKLSDNINIDKIPPEIIGVEDGKIYNNLVEIKYKDNIGLQKIEIFKYLENGQIRLEKNIYKLNEDGKYKIVVTDLVGNVTQKTITIKKPYKIE